MCNSCVGSFLGLPEASYASLDSRAKGCIVVEDAAKVMAAGAHTEPATEYPTPG